MRSDSFSETQTREAETTAPNAIRDARPGPAPALAHARDVVVKCLR